jgi:hypothetical protein
MTKGPSRLFLGMFILILSLILYNLTGNALGWEVLFIPGSVIMLNGLYLIFIKGE